MPTIDRDTIAENATSPKSATIDNQSVTQHSIGDQIMADKYRRKAGRNPANAFQRATVVPPGTGPGESS